MVKLTKNHSKARSNKEYSKSSETIAILCRQKLKLTKQPHKGSKTVTKITKTIG